MALKTPLAMALSSPFLVFMRVSGIPASLQVVFDVWPVFKRAIFLVLAKSRAATLFKSQLLDYSSQGDGFFKYLLMSIWRPNCVGPFQFL